jgi:YD repeat-containing protein
VDDVDEVAGVGKALAYDRGYRYDGAGRLTTVIDRPPSGTGVVLDPTAGPIAGAPCAVREYGFDDNGRRVTLTEEAHGDGNCSGDTFTTTQDLAYAYDSADRPTTARTGSVNGDIVPSGAYTYDAFGRQTTIPTADTPASATERCRACKESAEPGRRLSGGNKLTGRGICARHGGGPIGLAIGSLQWWAGPRQ